jgi:hypothetical protein
MENTRVVRRNLWCTDFQSEYEPRNRARNFRREIRPLSALQKTVLKKIVPKKTVL